MAKQSTPDWKDYTLLDSGNGRKLERFGAHTFDRPEPRAIWKPAVPREIWAQADAAYHLNARGGGGKWTFRREIERSWPMEYKGLRFWAEVSESRQLGVFPENAAQWDWIEAQVQEADRPVRALNLFGYTGLATLAAARAGAEVTHVDAAKRAVSLAKRNQQLSGLADKPIRWIVDDALKFVRREARRGRQYEGIIMDPPKYGLGPNKERWEFGQVFGELCAACRDVLSEGPRFVAVTAYALEEPAEMLRPYIEKMMAGFGGTVEVGELVTVEQSAGRKIAGAIYARWEKN